MEALWAIAFWLGWSTLWLITARSLYSRWRITSQEHIRVSMTCKVRHNRYGASDCCLSDQRNRRPLPDGWIVVGAMLCALIFPVIWLVAAVRYKPQKSPREIEAERNAMKARIKDMEKELLGNGGKGN